MDEGGGYGCQSVEDDDDATVFVDTCEVALHTLERSAGDAHGVAFGEILHVFVGEIGDAFYPTVADLDEMLHLTVGDNDGFFLTGIHKPAEGAVGTGGGYLDGLEVFFVAAHEYEVVDGGAEYPLTFVALLYETVFHRDIGLYLTGVEVGFEFKFTAIGCAQGIPMYFFHL